MAIQISWHHLDPSPTVEAEISRHYDKLFQYCNDITSARISLDHSQKQGSLHSYSITLEVKVPNKEIVVSHDPGGEAAHHDLHLLVHRSFESAARQLRDYNAIRHGKVKRHGPKPSVTNDDLEAGAL